MNISNRQQLMGVIAIATVAFFAGDKLILTPLVQGWKARSAQVAELKKSVTRGTMLLASENNIRTRWERMRTNALSGDMSTAEDQVFKAFERWSRASRVSISSYRPQPQGRRSANDLVTLECRADAAGTLSDLTRFLYEVEKDPLAVKVDLVEITSRDKEGRQLTLGLQVSGLLINPPGS
jgi:hypothetical protein